MVDMFEYMYMYVYNFVIDLNIVKCTKPLIEHKYSYIHIWKIKFLVIQRNHISNIPFQKMFFSSPCSHKNKNFENTLK